MGQNSQSGHNGVIAIEVDDGAGSVTAGVFVEVAETMGSLGPPKLSRETNERTPHKDVVPTQLVSDVIQFGEVTLDLDLLPAHSTHDLTTGFQKHFETKNRFGFNYQGPNYSADTTEDVLHSVRCIGVEITDGTKAEPHSMKVIIIPDGPYKVNGTTKGASGSWA